MSRIHDALKRAERERNEKNGQSSLRETSVDSVTPRDLGEEQEESPAVRLTDVLLRSELEFDILNEHCEKPHWSPNPERALFFESSRLTTSLDELWSLSSHVEELRGAGDLKSIVITSALPGEGKSFVAANLAQALARGRRRRVLLIDADLRFPTLHETFGAPCEHGLSNYLRGEMDELAVIQKAPIPNMFFIPAGNSVDDPASLIVSERWNTLIDRLRPCFDWIIVDSAPAAVVSDTTTLANACDGILLVVLAASTPFDVAQRAQSDLRGAPVLGVVLNRVSPNRKYSHRYQRPRSHGFEGNTA